MLDALNTAATGMDAQSKQVEVISNNIANADTVSFKRGRTEFQDLLYNNIKEPGAATSATTLTPTGIQVGVGARVSGVQKEFAMGVPRHTGGELDLCIEGHGFLAVQLPSGELAYTRDGSMRRGPTGRLETVDGLPFVPEITVPPEAGAVSITSDGRVSANVSGQIQELGQLQLTTFANPSGLNAKGGNLYLASPGSGAPTVGTPGDVGYGRLLSQYLEASNVSPVKEMTDLIRAQRVYELNSKVINTTDQMMNTLNQIR